MTIEQPRSKSDKGLFIAVLLVLTCLFLSHEAAAHTASRSQITITIESRIDPPDPQSGMKSHHQIKVNFRTKTIHQKFTTGTTKIFGKTLSSIRDKFRFRVIKWYIGAGHQIVKLHISGHTTSGVRVLPGIDYELTMYLANAGEVAIDGCHDGYPSYSIVIGSRNVYRHKHKAKRLYKLFGKCDTKMKKRIDNNHGWNF